MVRVGAACLVLSWVRVRSGLGLGLGSWLGSGSVFRIGVRVGVN